MAKQTIYHFEDFALNATRLQLFRQGESIRLEPQVIRLLALLVQNADRVVTKDEINQEIWNGRIVSDASLASRLRAARSAIGDNGQEQRLIRTLPNVGVQFVGHVTVDAPPLEETGFFYRAALVLRRLWLQLVAGGAVIALAAGLIWFLAFWLPFWQVARHFEKVPDAAISGYNDIFMTPGSLKGCMKACLEATEIECRSFDFYKKVNNCDLSNATAEEVGGLRTDYPGNPYDHYARKRPGTQ
ncbi:winged helix-turn-helix domain-containing protein [Ponticaulis profundi]|uniref:Winged helix-turn-helix domain-containing protein n=1 Tax=Ponticaulis profundi TaxID=2665222 RepID=A0ABW1S8R9_9PROT